MSPQELRTVEMKKDYYLPYIEFYATKKILSIFIFVFVCMCTCVCVHVDVSATCMQEPTRVRNGHQILWS